MACPYFVPVEMVSDGWWPHPSRLPLGAGWKGNCLGSGSELPASDEHTRDFCNLGNAAACPHLPLGRDWDAIRFSVARVSRERLTLCFVCERGHAPVEHGELIYDLFSGVWLAAHSDSRVLRLASSYLKTYRARGSVLV